MDILIDNRSGTPIYEQIYTQLKGQIISGALTQGEALPSIRALAKDLHISVITTKRAYDELERDGYLYAVAGKGFYVAAKNTQLLREELLRQVEAHVQEILRLAPQCGLTRADLLSLLQLLDEEEPQ